MRNYFKRLRAHPGVPVAAMLTIMFLIGGLANKNPQSGLIDGLAASLSIWLIVLITARTQPLPREEHRDD